MAAAMLAPPQCAFAAAAGQMHPHMQGPSCNFFPGHASLTPQQQLYATQQAMWQAAGCAVAAQQAALMQLAQQRQLAFPLTSTAGAAAPAHAHPPRPLNNSHLLLPRTAACSSPSSGGGSPSARPRGKRGGRRAAAASARRAAGGAQEEQRVDPSDGAARTKVEFLLRHARGADFSAGEDLWARAGGAEGSGAEDSAPPTPPSPSAATAPRRVRFADPVVASVATDDGDAPPTPPESPRMPPLLQCEEQEE